MAGATVVVPPTVMDDGTAVEARKLSDVDHFRRIGKVGPGAAAASGTLSGGSVALTGLDATTDYVLTGTSDSELRSVVFKSAAS